MDTEMQASMNYTLLSCPARITIAVMKTLSLGRKMSYAVGGLALNFANLLISQWLLRLYVPSLDGALVPVGLFSIIFLAGRIMDGITDPIVGYLSDHLRSRFGRRIPFITLALIPTALVSFLMWVPPVPGHMDWANGVFIFVMVQLFFIFWTLLANPYMSLLPELSADPKERVDISTMQAFFIMLGTILGSTIGSIKEAAGWLGLGLTVGVLTIVSFLPTILFVREPAMLAGQSATGAAPGVTHKPGISDLYRWILLTFRNPPFVLYLIATAIFWFSLNIMILLVPFWVEHVTGKGDGDVIFVMLPYVVANLAAFFAANTASKRWGKYPVYLVTLFGSGLVSLALCLVGLLPGDRFLQTQVVMGLYGVTTAGFLMLPNAILADIVDYDAARCGERREAIHFGVQAVFQKLSIGLSIAVASALMYAGGSQKPTVLGLKLIASCAGAAGLAAGLVFTKYGLREKA